MNLVMKKEPPVSDEDETAPTGIRARVKALMISTDIVDPHEMATVIIADLADEDLRAVLAEVLPGYVRVCFHQHQVPQREAPAKVDTTDQGSSASSSRWDHITAIYSRRVCPGGEWRSLGDCVRDEILALAAQSREQAARNTAQAKGWEDLAHRMEARGARLVSDMPVEEIPEVLR